VRLLCSESRQPSTALRSTTGTSGAPIARNGTSDLRSHATDHSETGSIVGAEPLPPSASVSTGLDERQPTDDLSAEFLRAVRERACSCARDLRTVLGEIRRRAGRAPSARQKASAALLLLGYATAGLEDLTMEPSIPRARQLLIDAAAAADQVMALRSHLGSMSNRLWVAKLYADDAQRSILSIADGVREYCARLWEE
jgi:hypothetical protein